MTMSTKDKSLFFLSISVYLEKVCAFEPEVDEDTIQEPVF